MWLAFIRQIEKGLKGFSWGSQYNDYLSADRSIEINPEYHIRRSLLITRSLLFILTSVFYLAVSPVSAIKIKIWVVLSFLIATILVQNLYDGADIQMFGQDKAGKSLDTTAITLDKIVPLRLIVVETIGVALLILPTGGLDSPFVWYALNPIIAAAVYLPGWFCWGTLALFLGTAGGVNLLYPGYGGSPLKFIAGHMSVLLVFIVSTSLAQVAVSLTKRLATAYVWLVITNEVKERSLEHISSLYQALEAFSTREDSAELVDVLAIYTQKLCRESVACLLHDGNEAILRFANREGADNGVDWHNEMRQLWNKMKPHEEVIIHSINKTAQIIAVPISSHGECFGMLACLQNSAEPNNFKEKRQTLVFLAGVAGIILERLKTEKLWARLLVSEEQNRIANEIHDGVAQYLFSMVWALDTISQQEGNLQDKKIKGQLQLVEETAIRAARELRASIYKLSPYKRGENIFVDNLASYLDDLGRLNGIQVDLQAEGSEEVLSSALRKALYRIVREASSNALRHGKCTFLKVYLSMLPNRTVLEVEDNGCGFKMGETHTSGGPKQGLGNWNMQQLTSCFNGEFTIQSAPGKGTLVRCTIPKNCKESDELKEATGT